MIRRASGRLSTAAPSVVIALVLMLKSAAAVADAAMPAGIIELDETVIAGHQEMPKVLYIVPWQQPDGLPVIELHTEFTDAELFRRLYPPAHRRELGYHEARRDSASNESDSRRN